MQQIEAVIDQFKLQEVRSALEGMGIEDFTESTIRCHQKGPVMMFRGAAFRANIVEKIKVEIIAADESVTGIVEAIGAIARTRHKEDCRIAIHPYRGVN
ncbi:MAG: transcriptional regulator [Geobacter sp.]|nr:MAG: transcriptional regulator [Geobacter sp.]